uniref:PABC domain-containing protein n=1 Tax=Caenorhabditis tropicalis TaxID=1561998 RepID=A0A1I7UC39_9PELO
MSDSSKPIDPIVASLTHFVDHPDQLAEHTMESVEWEAVEVLMPRILRGKSKDDVKQLLLAEIDGMSKKRLMAVLAGETLEESSSSEESEDDEEEEVETAMEIQENEQPEKLEENEDEKDSERASETSGDRIEEAEDNPENDEEEGEIHEDLSPNRSVTPPDPSPPKADEVDTDEEIDRQLEKDLEDFI